MMELKLNSAEAEAVRNMLSVTDITVGDVLTISEGEMVLSDKNNQIVVKSIRYLNPPNEDWKTIPVNL